MKIRQQSCGMVMAMAIMFFVSMMSLQAAAPLAPVGVSAKGAVAQGLRDGAAITMYAVDFRWKPNPKGDAATGFAVYVWSESQRDWSRLGSTRDLFWRLTEEQLPLAGKEYYFHVTAFNDEGESLPDHKLHVSFRDGKPDDRPANRVIFTSVPSGNAWVGKRYVYDGDAVTEGARGEIVYELATSARRAMINPTSGLVVWTPSQTGMYKFAVTARLADHPEVQTVQTWVVQVYEYQEPGDDVPMLAFTSTPAEQVRLGEVYRYDPQVKHRSDARIRFALDRGPAGVVIDVATGALRWSPVAEGSYTFVLRATAGDGPDAVASIQKWTVRAYRDDTPETEFFFATTPVGIVEAGEEYRYDADVWYNGKGRVQFLLDAPDGAVVDAGTGVITWSPTLADEGLYKFYLRAVVDDVLSTHEVIQAWAVRVTGDKHRNDATGELATGIITGMPLPVLEVMARPNPAVDELVLQFDATAGTAHLTLYDAAGMEVLRDQLHTSDGSNTASMNVSMLPVGQYFLHVELNGGRQTLPVRISR